LVKQDFKIETFNDLAPGKLLMKVFINIIKNMGIRRIVLSAIDECNTINFYKNLSFKLFKFKKDGYPKYELIL
jgi:hypothetical protein